VIDADNNTNSYKKTVYVGDSDTPVAVMDLKIDNNDSPVFDSSACNGK